MNTISQGGILTLSIKNSLGICDGSCVGVKGCVRSCRVYVAEALEHFLIDPTQLPIVGSRPQLTLRQRGLLRVYLGLETAGEIINPEDSPEPPASSFGGEIIACSDDEL